MATHTIEVSGISDELIELLDERVRQTGRDRAEIVRELIRKELQEGSPSPDRNASPRPEMSFAEILAPVHQQVAESGMTEEELDRLFEVTRQRVRAAKRAAGSQ